MRTPLRRKPIRKSGRRAPQKKVLDQLCRALVFERDGHRCVRCGATTNLQWAHVYSRRYLATRWARWGSMALCAGCHLLWHSKPVDAAFWWVQWAGDERATELRERLNSGVAPNLKDLEQRLRMGVL